MATGSFPAAHQASPSGVVYAGQETQLNILSMEEDDFSDHESVKVVIPSFLSSFVFLNLMKWNSLSFFSTMYAFLCMTQSLLKSGTSRRSRRVQNVGKTLAAQCSSCGFYEFRHVRLRSSQFGKFSFIHVHLKMSIDFRRVTIFFVDTVFPFDNGFVQRRNCQGHEKMGLRNSFNLPCS